MHVEIELASQSQHGALIRNLNQLYLYEFSRFDSGFPLGADGRFDDSDLDEAWADTTHGRISLIRADGAAAGYAIVILDLEDEHLGSVHELDEFFILAAYQKRGIGEQAARQIFDQHRGHWELCVLESNQNALAFWRRMLERYTEGRFTERARPEERDILMAFSNH